MAFGILGVYNGLAPAAKAEPPMVIVDDKACETDGVLREGKVGRRQHYLI